MVDTDVVVVLLLGEEDYKSHQHYMVDHIVHGVDCNTLPFWLRRDIPRRRMSGVYLGRVNIGVEVAAVVVVHSELRLDDMN